MRLIIVDMLHALEYRWLTGLFFLPFLFYLLQIAERHCKLCKMFTALIPAPILVHVCTSLTLYETPGFPTTLGCGPELEAVDHQWLVDPAQR